jgi:hypothetical protein
MKINLQLLVPALAGLALSNAFSSSRGVLQQNLGSSSNSRLNGMILILENDDDNDDNDKENAFKKSMGDTANQASSSSSDMQSLPSGEIHFIVEGDDEFHDKLSSMLGAAIGASTSSSSSLSSRSMIETWKQQLATQPVPPLTAGARARFETEIALLEELKASEAATSKLANLWRNARGHQAAKILSFAEGLILKGIPLLWRQAELLLLALIQEEGVHWVEPIHQLATLRFLQGRVEESKELYEELVLKQKPWHMGALLGIHKACRSTDDYKGLARWDPEQKPSLQDTRERVEWVQRMVEKATAAYQHAEQGLQSFFVDYEDTASAAGGSEGGNFLLDNDEAWQ